MDEVLLDTDILSEVLKARNPCVLDRAKAYLAQHQRLCFSAMTAYEVIRGLHASGATRQLLAFEQTIRKSQVLPLDMPVLLRAAELWADGRKGATRTTTQTC